MARRSRPIRAASGQRLKKLRQAAGLTQQEAADRIGMHIRSYQRLESGETPAVRPAYIAVIAAAAAEKRSSA